jgi:hypothetical protein
MGAAVFHQKLEVAYTQIVRMSIDDHHILKASRASVGAQRIILSDAYRTVQNELVVTSNIAPRRT